MATPTFKYPDTTSPTTTLEFARAVFTGDYPVSHSSQESEESDYGEILSKNYGSNYKIYPVTVQVPKSDQDGNTADVSKIDTFCNITINWTKRAFYYTDSDEVSHYVKLMNKDLSDQKEYVSYMQYRFILREIEE